MLGHTEIKDESDGQQKLKTYKLFDNRGQYLIGELIGTATSFFSNGTLADVKVRWFDKCDVSY